ncbi:MAG: penicillin-binding transpeptidase domain-containing protein, partial [Cyanobium sp.]
NPVALHLADRVGFDKVIQMARRLGISSDALSPDPSMVLGGNEVLLYEMARAYAVVANGGRAVSMHGVQRIYDLGICGSEKALSTCPAQGIFTPLAEKPQQLIEAPLAEQMDAMLRRAVAEGTGRNAGVVADARGKTGTTNNGVDAWFIGYSPNKGILTGIWMGNDDNRPAPAAAGALAAELWGRYMSQV